MGHKFRIFARLFPYLRPYTGELVLSTLCMLGVAAMTALSALIIKNVLDDVFLKGDRRMLLLIPLAILVIYLVKGIFRYFRVYLMSRTGVNIVQDIRNDLYEHLHRLSLSYFTDTPTGVLMSRVTYDVSMVQTALTEAIVGVFRDFFMIVGLAGVVFYRNATLGLLAMVGLPLAYYPLVVFGKRM
ncbi:MAG: ABC transporter permease, partial [Proteobacteria bacterium]|nr:ABC transporter permease [Pseudomonadota bacterium]